MQIDFCATAGRKIYPSATNSLLNLNGGAIDRLVCLGKIYGAILVLLHRAGHFYVGLDPSVRVQVRAKLN